MKDDMNYAESLDIINQMISEAKSSYGRGGSFYFLLWGWIVLIANVLHFLLERFTDFSHPYAVWLITIPAVIITISHKMRSRQHARAVTHLSRLYGEVWIAVGVGVVLSILFMESIDFNHNAMIMVFAGAGTYITGRMLKFRPLFVGAIILWVTAIVCFNLPPTEQYLTAGIGMLGGYLIPGYLLKSRES